MRGRLVGADGRARDCPGCGGCVGGGGCAHRLMEVGVELVFIEEQETLARAVMLGRDLPRDGGGPGSADLQDAVDRRTFHKLG